MRVYANYTEEEFKLLEREAKKYGFSVSAYVKYQSLLPTRQVNDYDTAELIKNMNIKLDALASGETFIVSALVPEWVHLSRSVKMTLSKYLTDYVNNNSGYIVETVSASNQAKVYKKL